MSAVNYCPKLVVERSHVDDPNCFRFNTCVSVSVHLLQLLSVSDFTLPTLDIDNGQSRWNPARILEETEFGMWIALVFSVVLLEESPCHRGPIYKSLSLDLKSLSLHHKVLEISRTSHSANCPLCTIMWWCDVHKFCYRRHAWDTVKNVLLTDVRYYSLMPESQSFFTVTQCCCPRGKTLSLSLSFKSLSSRSEDQFTSSCPSALSPWVGYNTARILYHVHIVKLVHQAKHNDRPK